MMQADVKPSYADVGDARLAYSRRGDGPPLVLIQGVGVHGEGWRPQVDALAAKYACLWFDNRGVGNSQPPARRLSVDSMARDTAAILDAVNWTDAHVVGHSLGGLVALRLALSAPDRVRSLSLLCTFARGRDAGASARMAWIGLRTRLGTRRMRRAAFLEILAPADALLGVDRERMAQAVAPLFGHDLADHPRIEGQQLAALRAEDMTSELHKISAPTLVVSAAHDPISPPALGRALAAAIPGACHELLSDQAHGAPILASQTVNTLLLAHLDRVETTRTMKAAVAAGR